MPTELLPLNINSIDGWKAVSKELLTGLGKNTTSLWKSARKRTRNLGDLKEIPIV
jgi:hypothetical protein